jgi:hypothetical protein
MLSFNQFIVEDLLDEATLSSSGKRAPYDLAKYVTPFIGQKDTHYVEASKKHSLSPDAPVTIHGHTVINGAHHAIVSQGEGPHVTVPFSNIHKPTPESQKTNKGHEYESKFLERLKQHKIAPAAASAAGSTGGTDFPIITRRNNKATQRKARVTADESVLNGETKKDHTAAFGQLTIAHTPEKGWHIPEKTRQKRPRYAAAIEKAGIIEHMNKHHGDPSQARTTSSGRAANVTLDHPNMKPAEEYLRDHHVDVLQVGGGKGTYKVGDTDKTGHGLPSVSGTGQWTVRQKQALNPSSRTVQFSPKGAKGLNPSHVNLDKDEHIEPFKKTIGVTD